MPTINANQAKRFEAQPPRVKLTYTNFPTLAFFGSHKELTEGDREIIKKFVKLTTGYEPDLIRSDTYGIYCDFYVEDHYQAVR